MIASAVSSGQVAEGELPNFSGLKAVDAFLYSLCSVVCTWRKLKRCNTESYSVGR